jgi:hypothetical protein
MLALLSSGWDVYEQRGAKLAFRFRNDTSKPRRMPELRHAKTGKSELKDGALRTIAPGEARWIVIEAYDAPNYWVDDTGVPGPRGTHPGTAVYWKSEADAEQHWEPVADKQAKLDELAAHGLTFPVELLAMTTQSLGLGHTSIHDARVQLFTSKARVLGRVAHEHATLPQRNREEDLAPGDLLAIELKKEKELHLQVPVVVRRIDQPAIRGSLWTPLGVSASVCLHLLAEACETLEGAPARIWIQGPVQGPCLQGCYLSSCLAHCTTRGRALTPRD